MKKVIRGYEIGDIVEDENGELSTIVDIREAPVQVEFFYKKEIEDLQSKLKEVIKAVNMLLGEKKPLCKIENGVFKKG